MLKEQVPILHINVMNAETTECTIPETFAPLICASHAPQYFERKNKIKPPHSLQDARQSLYIAFPERHIS